MAVGYRKAAGAAPHIQRKTRQDSKMRYNASILDNGSSEGDIGHFLPGVLRGTYNLG
jgi:hypothetical protein